MASFGNGGFNATAPENNQTNLIPKGDYPAVLVKSEQKPTKDGKGSYLTLDFQITSGEFQNKHVFEQLNLWLTRDKQDAINIAKGQLSELCKAVNVLNPIDSNELHNKPLIIKVGIQEATESFRAKNKITGYKPRSAVVNQQPVPPAVQQQPVEQTANSGNPW